MKTLKVGLGKMMSERLSKPGRGYGWDLARDIGGEILGDRHRLGFCLFDVDGARSWDDIWSNIVV